MTPLIIRDGTVEYVLYPVFPPDRNAEQVLDWLRIHREHRDGVVTAADPGGRDA